jgi:tetrahydromethanopterin S-methyltransferase subunit D
MFLPQSGLLGFTRNINAIPVPNQVTSKTSFVPFTDAGNDWQGRYYPIRMADGNWCAVWMEGTFHSDYNSATHTVNIHFSNDEGVTWTDNNEYFGSVPVTGFPLIPPGGTATGFVDFCLTLCPNGDLVLIAQNRGVNASAWNGVNFSQHQYRSTDNGATWAYEFDFCDAIGENTVALRAKIQGLFETMIIGDDLYVILCQIRTDLNDTRIRIYKTTDNCATWSFLSNPIEYDEVDPDCTESALAHLGNGRIICVFRTEDLGQALWKTSNDYGLTWGAVTDFAPQLGYVGLHQPRIKAYSNFFLVMGRDNKTILNDPTLAVYERNSWWTTDDLFATTCDRYYLDPFYTGTGVISTGDAGYTRAVQKNDGSFMFFGYYGVNSASLIYKYDVSHTNSPSTEVYANNNFFPETITATGIRLQMNRDNIQVTTSPAAVAAHNTLETGGLQFATAGTAPEFQVALDKGWLNFASGRIVSDTSLANTFFRASFSFGFWLWPDDGQPATAQSVFRCSSVTDTTTVDLVRFQLSTDGKVLVGYAANGTNTNLVPASAIFANGAVGAPVHIACTFTSGGIIRLYVNGVLQTDDGTNTGSMAAITMTNYSTTNPMYWCQRQTGASTFDLPYTGRIREFLLQPVIWSAGDITNIMLN